MQCVKAVYLQKNFMKSVYFRSQGAFTTPCADVNFMALWTRLYWVNDRNIWIGSSENQYIYFSVLVLRIKIFEMYWQYMIKVRMGNKYIKSTKYRIISKMFYILRYGNYPRFETIALLMQLIFELLVYLNVFAMLETTHSRKWTISKISRLFQQYFCNIS